MKIKVLALLLVSACSAFAAEQAPLQLRGVLNTGKETLFGLATPTGDRTAWVGIGKQFDGYTVKSYDDAQSLLLFERDGKTYELKLAEAAIQTAEAQDGAAATVADASALLDRMNFEEMIERTFAGQKKAMANMSQQMARQMGVAAPTKEMEEHQAKVMDVLMEAMNPAQMKKDMAEIYAQTFTREELRAMGDFYNTQAGLALLEKTPVVQEKFQQMIMPRMAAAMPKIQKMSMDFAQQLKTKTDAAKAAAGATTTEKAAAPAAAK